MRNAASLAKAYANRLDLIEIMHTKTHAACGDVQFDCPTVLFSPPREIIAQYGSTTVVAVKADYKPISTLLDFTENEIKRLRTCVSRFKNMETREKNVKYALTHGKKIKQDELEIPLPGNVKEMNKVQIKKKQTHKYRQDETQINESQDHNRPGHRELPISKAGVIVKELKAEI